MTGDTAEDPEPYELPTHEAGRMLIADWRVLSEILDDEDVGRALHPDRSSTVSAPRATLEP